MTDEIVEPVVLNLTPQGRIMRWLRECFGDEVASNRAERAARVLEEACELAQAEGVGVAQVGAICHRVYGRPVGVPEREGAGVMVAMLGWAGASWCDLDLLVEGEVARIESIGVEEWRRRHQAKAAAGTALAGTPTRDVIEAAVAWVEAEVANDPPAENLLVGLRVRERIEKTRRASRRRKRSR